VDLPLATTPPRLAYPVDAADKSTIIHGRNRGPSGATAAVTGGLGLHLDVQAPDPTRFPNTFTCPPCRIKRKKVSVPLLPPGNAPAFGACPAVGKVQLCVGGRGAPYSLVNGAPQIAIRPSCRPQKLCSAINHYQALKQARGFRFRRPLARGRGGPRHGDH